MLTKDDFTKYKHQSFFLKLKELVANPNTNPFTFKMVFFGGTGAVGGQAVIEVLESYAYMKNASIEEPNARPQLVITGINKSQIEQFCGKLFQVFGKQQFKTVAEQGDESVLLYDGGSGSKSRKQAAKYLIYLETTNTLQFNVYHKLRRVDP